MRWPLIFLTIVPISVGSAMAEPGDRWSIVGDNVNLRRGPGTGHEIKRQLSQSQDVIEHGRDDEWRHVEVVGTKGLLGWVHQSLLAAKSGDAQRPVISVSPVSPPDPTPEMPLDVRKAFLGKEEPGAEPPIEFVDPDELVDPDKVLDEMRSYVKRREKLPKDPAPPRVGQSGREIISPVPIRNPGDQSRVPTELVLASSPEVVGIDVDAMEDFRDSVSYLNSRAWSVAGIKLFSEIEPVGGGVVQVKTTKDWFDVPNIGQTSYLNTLVDRWSSAKADGAPAGVMLVDPKGDLLMHQTKP